MGHVTAGETVQPVEVEDGKACGACQEQALTGSDFQLRVGSGSELKSRVVGYPRVG